MARAPELDPPVEYRTADALEALVAEIRELRRAVYWLAAQLDEPV